MYSQNKEEEIILREFSKEDNGRFLDIGAFHPFLLSNTRALFEKGWSGVFVEPGVTQMDDLRKEYESVPRVELCSNAIATTAGTLKFFITPNDALSTLSTDHLIKWKNVKFEETVVEAITPDMLFAKYGYDFDFIDLDIEGNNWDILQLLPFEALTKLKLICIEYDNKMRDISNFMTIRGFKEIHENGENMIFKKTH